MKLTRNQVIIVLGAVVLVGVILYFFMSGSGSKPAPAPAVTLKVWGIDPKPVFENFNSAYAKMRPNVTVNYTQVDEENYRSRLLDALAPFLGHRTPPQARPGGCCPACTP
jgi:ABC-type glycerol-3-phosphate transport system substrate-binding protein